MFGCTSHITQEDFRRAEELWRMNPYNPLRTSYLWWLCQIGVSDRILYAYPWIARQSWSTAIRVFVFSKRILEAISRLRLMHHRRPTGHYGAVLIAGGATNLMRNWSDWVAGPEVLMQDEEREGLIALQRYEPRSSEDKRATCTRCILGIFRKAYRCGSPSFNTSTSQSLLCPRLYHWFKIS